MIKWRLILASAAVVCGVSFAVAQFTGGLGSSSGGTSTNPSISEVCDPTAPTTCASVKAASTAAVATDKSLVVQLNPNSPGITALGQTTMAASLPVAIASNQSPVASGVNTGNVNTTPHICGSSIFKHITTTTDTEIVPISGTTTIYVCDYEISFGGTGNISLEQATAGAVGTCTTITQIGQVWYGVVNAGKAAGNPYWRGLKTAAGAKLCANTTANVSIDITVYYDQY